jgi:hypothetical protein
MKRPIRLAACLLGLVPLLVVPGSRGFTFNFPGGGNPGFQPPTNGYPSAMYRPLGPDNSRGVAPASGYQQPYQQPYQQQPYQQQPYRQTYQPQAPYGYGQPRQTQLRPRLEAELSDSRPYVQENILLTLRVISGSNLNTIDPILPQNQSVTFHQVKQPVAFSRRVGGQTQIVNELVYMVTPLRPGEIEFPVKASVEGGDHSGSTTLETSQPVRMEARPAQPGVVPWLPLEQLALTSNIDAPMEVEPGKPVSLVLKLSAAGATGGQLPSLEQLLQSPDFRVYREKSDTEGGLSKNGRHIMGIRTEHYTLVPQYSGRLRLPSARLTWFNVNTGTVEHTSLPIQTLESIGEEAGLERLLGPSESGSLFPTGYASAFWLPLLGVLLLLTGYWIGVWYKGRKEGERSSPLAPLGRVARQAASGVRRRSGQALGRISPMPYWNRLMVRSAALLPTPVRFWFWVRCANDERDPGLWCKTLQFLSCRQLTLSPYAPLPQMAEKVIQFQPRANPEQVRQLFRRLDGAIYGGEPIDFEQWKQDFRKQVRPRMLGLAGGSGTGRDHKERELPELNPKAA